MFDGSPLAIIHELRRWRHCWSAAEMMA